MKRRLLIFLLVLVALSPILILREATPSNELRYLNIVDQALESGNMFAFYDHETPYADKPPLYFWCMMGLKKIFGSHIMFFLSLLSLVPAFVTTWVLDKWIGERLPRAERAAAMLMLLTSGFFLAGEIVLRQDMMMCMFITLSLYAFYRGRRLLLPLFVFLAIFSKGAVGLLVPLVSIAIFLVWKKEYKKIGYFLGWRFWSILLALCALWFLGVYLDGGKEYLNNLLFHQTLDRAVNSFHHKAGWWFYLGAWWYIFAPWCLLVVTACITGAKAKLFSDDSSRLLVVAGISIFITLSVISSKIAIYALPIIPFFIYLAAIALSQRQSCKWIKLGVWLPAVLFILIFIASFFAGKMVPEMPKLWAPLPLLTLFLALGGFAAIGRLIRDRTTHAVVYLAAALMVTLFVAGFSTGSVNRLTGAKEICEKAIDEAAAKNKEIYYYRFDKAPNLDYYFKKGGRSVQKLDAKGLREFSGGILLFKEKYLSRDSLLRAKVSDDYIVGGDRICVTEI